MDGSKKNAYTILELEPSPDLEDAVIKKVQSAELLMSLGLT